MIWLVLRYMLVCSPCNREPLSVRLTSATYDPVVDIADSLVCQGLAQYVTGDNNLVYFFVCRIQVKIESSEIFVQRYRRRGLLFSNVVCSSRNRSV